MLKTKSFRTNIYTHIHTDRNGFCFMFYQLLLAMGPALDLDCSSYTRVFCAKILFGSQVKSRYMKILTIKGKAAQCIEEDREGCRGIIMTNECLSQTHSIIHTSKLGFLLSAGCRSHDDKWGSHWEKTLTASVSDKRCESRLHTKCYWIMGQGEPSSNGHAQQQWACRSGGHCLAVHATVDSSPLTLA